MSLYRIPLIAVAPNGDLVAITEGRKINGNDMGYKFISQRSIASEAVLGVYGDQKWSPTHEEVDDGYTTPSGVILGAIVTDYVTKTMFVVYGECIHDCPTSQTFVVNSTDNGRSWSEPVDISSQVGSDKVAFAAGPGTGIQVCITLFIYLFIVIFLENVYASQRTSCCLRSLSRHRCRAVVDAHRRIQVHLQ